MEETQSNRTGSGKSPVLVKLVLVGKLGVGKSAMIVRFLTKRFIGEYDQTVGLIYHHYTKIENVDVRLEILESGDKDFIERNDVHSLWGDVFFLVYAINDRLSFKEIIALREHLVSVRAADQPFFLLIGNKKDTENDRQEQVTTREGYELAKDMKCSFSELSSKTSFEDVEKVFLQATGAVMRRKMSQQALNGVKQTSHKRIMEIIEKNTGRNRAMSSVKETIDEYCVTRSRELEQELSRDRSNTYA
ncbi:ras-related and estrogen-regulated growth inhibitor-like [Montipora capricornis]|uniref:ras-related and estrogen-regulated growth inhibitor-like n=1 Tax=Montipora capricornis TaxID=246305 RepID=UPI0035F21BEE